MCNNIMMAEWVKISCWTLFILTFSLQLGEKEVDDLRFLQNVQKAIVTLPKETQQELTASAVDRCHKVYHSADFLRGLILDVFNMLQIEGSSFVNDTAQKILTSLPQLGEQEVDDLRFLQNVTLDEAQRIINETVVNIKDYMDSCLEFCLFLKSPIVNEGQISDLRNMSENFHKKTLIVKGVVMRRSKEMEDMLAEFGDYVWAFLIRFESAQDEVLKRMAALGHMLSSRRYYVSRCRRKVASNRIRLNQIVIKLIKKLEAQIPKKLTKTNGAVILY
ncbi:hypothetical protein B566_EDAN010923 [Ephemera danica]|nr:hypothetical protein B566_EDAN010923 [Ephemera danica]